MPQITIRQTGSLSDSPNAELSFDGEAGFAIQIKNPFSEQEEARLAWYFEEWLNFPFTQRVRAEEAASSVRRYGEQLFAQSLHSNPQIYNRYRQLLQQGVERLIFQIIGDPDFHQLHWEALWDPDRPRPLTLDAAMIRSAQQPTIHSYTQRSSPTLNLLLVTARPQGIRDVGYRTIQRPLIEMLRQSQLPVQVDIVRPGTWRALVEQLRSVRQHRGVGHYQIIHFDLHGAVLSPSQLAGITGASPHSFKVRPAERFARADLADLKEQKTAWLFFEDEVKDDLDAASAEEVAGLLLEEQIPIAILNACQSGQETGDSETSLGSRLLQAGVQTVLAMGYSVTVSAARQLMQALYGQLFQPPHDLLSAISAGRAALHNDKGRNATYNQRIRLEDWLLPVVYQPSPQIARTLPLRAMSFEEEIAFYQQQSARYSPPEPEYGFVGRDIDILQIEKRLLRQSEGKQRNLLLIQGMGGTGKSTLLRHLASWWQMTALLHEVFYFGYDERAYSLQQLLDAIARSLLNRAIPAGAVVAREYAAFQAMQPQLQMTLLAKKLRGERHLLILDNLESVTGDPLAIPNTLPASEQAAIRGFLYELLGGQTLVLLGSRGGGEWLQGGVNPPLRAIDHYALPGLDHSAAADLAERILQRQVADESQRQAYAASDAFARLIQLLDGSPLALEVVLANLAHQPPEQILQALQTGDSAIDPLAAQTATVSDADAAQANQLRTRSILHCVAYSHSNLDAEAQRLLLCLFPFSGVIGADPQLLNNYIGHLVTLAPTLNAARLPDLLTAAQSWGLLTPHEAMPGFLRIQPVLPYFLKTRLAQEAGELQGAIETAFRSHYSDLAKAIFKMSEAKDAQQRQIALGLCQAEYENLSSALQLCLAAHEPFFDLYAVIELCLTSLQDHRRGIDLGMSIQKRMAEYPPNLRYGNAGASFLRVLGNLGDRQRTLKRYAEAEASYQAAAQLIEQITNASPERKADWQATLYHQLGMVAQKQRQWAQAEQHYQQALALKIEFNDRYSQASTYHNLGMVAQAQRQWAQAEQHYQQALALKIEFNDRYEQAGTYHNLGAVAQAQRQWAQAEQHYQQALALFIEFNDRYSQASTYQGLGAVAQEQRQWAQAEQHYQQALTICIEFNDRYSQARTYHQLGSVVQEQRQWAQAEQHYQQALALFIEFNDRYSQASTYQGLGAVAQEQRQWAQAEQHFQSALALKIEFNERYSQANTYQGLGAVAQEQRQWAQAEQHYQQALALKIEFNDRYSQASTYHQLGSVAQEQRQWAQAEQHYQQALALFIEFNDRYSQAITYHQLGIVAIEQRQWAQAEQHYQQALALFIEFNDRYSLAKTYGQLGILAQEQRQWAQAEQHYQQVLALYIEFDDRYSQASTIVNLGSLAEDQEQWTQAYTYYIEGLAIAVEFQDDYRIGTRFENIQELWQKHPDDAMLPAIAKALALSIQEVQSRLQKQE